MNLSVFIQSLFEKGEVSVVGDFQPFTPEDKVRTILLLRQYYDGYVLEMPGTAPVFDEEAALWAASYFYLAVKLAVLRDAGDELIAEKLCAFTKHQTPTPVCSGDLVFNHLPSHYKLAQGLAPADLLVRELRETAAKWPFSSVGIELKRPVEEDILFSDASLKQAYIDRIIELKDKKRALREPTRTYILETIGQYNHRLWPDLETC